VLAWVKHAAHSSSRLCFGDAPAQGEGIHLLPDISAFSTLRLYDDVKSTNTLNITRTQQQRTKFAGGTNGDGLFPNGTKRWAASFLNRRCVRGRDEQSAPFAFTLRKDGTLQLRWYGGGTLPGWHGRSSGSMT